MSNSSKLSQQIRAALAGSPALQKLASDLPTGEEVAGKMTTATDPAAAQTGAVADVIKAEIDGPGEASNATEAAPAINESEIGDASGANENIDVDAAKILAIKEEPVTKENLDMIDKAANAMRAVASKLVSASDERIHNAFAKVASAVEQPAELSSVELLQKMANEGDAAAQHMVDFMASYNAGLAKKANDMAEALPENATAEDVEAAEEALNAQAIGELEAADAEGIAVEDGAVLEAAAQEAIIETATQLLEADPELTEEEAVVAAQDAVVDAIEVLDAQQLIGAVNDEGQYMVDDEVAEEAVSEMLKSASAYPLRDHLCGKIGNRLGLDPSAFAARISK